MTAAARLGVKPAQCVVVEDVVRRGGMRSIGVSRKTTLAADIFAQSLADLPGDAFARLMDAY